MSKTWRMIAASQPLLKKHRFRRVSARLRTMGMKASFTDFHHLDMAADYDYPLHCHAGYEAILVEKGPYGCELNSATLTLNAGAVLIIKPGDWHADHLRTGQRHYVLHFLLERTSGAKAPDLFKQGVKPSEQVALADVDRDAALLREIRRESEQGADHASAVQDGLLAALFWRWVRALPGESLSREWRALPGVEARREELAELFARHVRGNPTVAELAREMRVSARQFTTQCVELLGMSPARLLLDFKLREAEAMLKYQGLRVNEVSDALGFVNPYHFSRVCRRAWGKPPSALSR